jgi:formate dehydrogenase iron-sulfur subunit
MDPLFQAVAHVLGAGLMQLAILISMTHLGRPLYAFRAVLGFRRSWLSREIVAFGLLAGIAAAVAAGTLLTALTVPNALHPGTSALLAQWGPALGRWGAFGSAPWLRISLAVSAILAVHCSAMVYRDTPRALWAGRITSGKFFLSGTLTGLAGVLLLVAGFAAAADGPFPGVSGRLALGLILALPVAMIAKLGCESRIHRHLDDQEANPLKKAALLLRGALHVQNIWRFNFGLAGGFLLPVLWMYRGYAGTGADVAFAAIALALILAGECLERYLFFAACVPPRMPGA